MTPDTITEELEILQARIAKLKSLEGEDLGSAMRELQQVLKSNPQITANLLPENIGELVASLRRHAGKEREVRKESAKKSSTKKTSASTKVSAEEAADLFDFLKSM